MIRTLSAYWSHAAGVAGLVTIATMSFATEPDARAHVIDVTSARMVNWTIDTGGDVGAVVALRNDRALVAARRIQPLDGETSTLLQCVDTTTGHVLWSKEHAKLAQSAWDNPASGLRSPPVVDEGRVFYLSNAGVATCLDLEGFLDGEDDGVPDSDNALTLSADVVWEKSFRDEFGVFKRDDSEFGNPLPSPSIADDRIVFGTANGSILGFQHAFVRSPYRPAPEAPSLVCMNKFSGQVLWQSPVSSAGVILAGWSSPVVVQSDTSREVIYAGGDGCVYGLSIATGVVRWKVDINDAGATDWTVSASGTRTGIIGTPIVKGSRIYVCTGIGANDRSLLGGRLVCIDRAGIIWQVKLDAGTDFLVAPVLENGLLFAQASDGSLRAVDASDGRVLWKDQGASESPLFAQPFAIDGMIAVPNSERLVFYAVSRFRDVVGILEFPNLLQGRCDYLNGTLFVATRTSVYAVDMKEVVQRFEPGAKPLND
jgi:outer membrane protein assembly factor BamB